MRNLDGPFSSSPSNRVFVRLIRMFRLFVDLTTFMNLEVKEQSYQDVQGAGVFELFQQHSQVDFANSLLVFEAKRSII